MRPNLACLMLLLSLLQIRCNADPLAIGPITATNGSDGVVLSVASPLSGGTGTGYAYLVFRDTTAAVSVVGTPLATLTTLPYTDTSAKSGTLYFYKVVGHDSGTDIVYSAPAGLSNVDASNDTDLSVAGERTPTVLKIVFGGDSITYGATLEDPANEAPPVQASADLAAMAGIRSVFFSNQGHSGHTTSDFLPPSSQDYKGLVNAANLLAASHPTGQLVFSLMLGTNDSATSGTDVCQRTPDEIKANYVSIIGQLLIDFPSAKVIVNYAPFYTPNTHNGANYEAAGLARLISYSPAIDAAVAVVNRAHPGHVFVGDQTAQAFFAQVYRTELTPENGQDGTFYLHPNKQGAVDLGRLWAEAIYHRLIESR